MAGVPGTRDQWRFIRAAGRNSDDRRDVLLPPPAVLRHARARDPAGDRRAAARVQAVASMERGPRDGSRGLLAGACGVVQAARPGLLADFEMPAREGAVVYRRVDADHPRGER